MSKTTDRPDVHLALEVIRKWSPKVTKMQSKNERRH